MKPLFELIKEIANEAKNLHLAQLGDESIQLHYVCIFTKDPEHYDFYADVALKLGELHKENSTGIYIVLKEEVDTNEGKVKFIKVRKPDPGRSETGAVDYTVEDFEAFKEKHISDVEFKVNSEDIELGIVRSENTDVFIAVLSKPIFNLEVIDGDDDDDRGETLDQQLEDEKQKRLQLMSDFQNYQRRVESEKAMFGAIANMSLIQDLLEVFDDMNLAIQDDNLNLDGAKSSIQGAQNKVVAAIERAGVERVEVKIGDEFDKEKMEAISTVPVKEEDKKNKVIAVINSAFKYKGRDGIIKAAKVVVGK